MPERVTFYSEQTHPDFAPRGADGGGDALPDRGVTVIGPDGVEVTGLAEKAVVTLQPGTVLRVETAGGGGYGDPRRRSADALDYDRRNGRI